MLLALLSYRSLESRAESVGRVTRTLVAITDLQQVMSLLKDAETGQRGYLLVGESYLDPFKQALTKLPKAFDDARRLRDRGAEQAERFDELERLSALKITELQETVDLKRSGSGDAAIEQVRSGRGRDLMNQIRTTIAQMVAYERAQLDQSNSALDHSQYLSLLVTLGGLGVLLFVITAAVVISSREFRAEQLQGWLRTSVGELAALMQGNQDVDTIGDKAVRFLADRLGAQLGVLYYTGAGFEPRIAGRYALSPDATAPPGGVTLRSIKEGALVVLDDVPRDYFALTSGLGASRPRSLLVAPTTVDGVPNGGVELGFLHRVPAEALELMRLTAAPIGVAMRAAMYRREVDRLLEETQKQAEELQTQQEELRVNNEELEQQSQTLRASQERLNNQQAELEQTNVLLEEQTRELETQRDDLLRAGSDLQRASTYKSEFLANMSHELRTPLNSTLILAKLLADNRNGNLDEEQIKFAQTIYSAGNDLLTLINDILDLSKIEAGKLDVRVENVTVARLVDELQTLFTPIAADKKLALEVQIDGTAPAALQTDPTRLQQILKNLLSNALKFTDRGGVTLRVRGADAGMLSFEVKDTGIGIAPDQQEVIFEAFRQADGTVNRKYGGTGLGLSISRDLARLLGGELTVQSEAGRGSTFVLTIPENHTRRESKRPEAARRQAVSARGSFDGPPPAAASGIVDDRASLTASSRVLLIIEDDLDFMRIVQDLARELDFVTLAANTAEEGIALAERFRPSGIVLDMGLPDRSGLSVLDTLKHSGRTRHIPVHIISVENHAQVAREMGAAGYAIKPIARADLAEALHRLETRFTQKLRRVLVVEDDATHRESTSKLLAGDDVTTVAVGTAAEALDQLRTTTFDCMVLDLSLPDRSGFEVLEEMSSQDRGSFPPVIVYTGRSLTSAEEQRLRRYSSSIVIKGARSPERLLHEVTLFLHQVEAELPPDRQRMLAEARHREAVFEGKQVLIVEDDVRNVFALTRVLEPKGARVGIARNGREALDYLTKHDDVDLVLMDIMMPEMNGLEAMRELRKRPELAKLPIIALTAKAMADDRDHCIAAGANDYIAKPLDVDKLLSLARVWMRK